MTNPYQRSQPGQYNPGVDYTGTNNGYYGDSQNGSYGTMGQPSSMPKLGQNASNQKTFPTLPGMLVNTPDDILAKDVPMDGTVSLFLMSDLSSILAKQWNANGTIDTVQFVRVQNNETPSGDALSQIMERLDRIETALKKPRYSGTKKSYHKPNNGGEVANV